MTEDQLKSLVQHYQQLHANAVLEGAQFSVLHQSAVAENARLQERVNELEGAALKSKDK
jgi:hypothetical protein